MLWALHELHKREKSCNAARPPIHNLQLLKKLLKADINTTRKKTNVSVKDHPYIMYEKIIFAYTSPVAPHTLFGLLPKGMYKHVSLAPLQNLNN